MVKRHALGIFCTFILSCWIPTFGGAKSLTVEWERTAGREWDDGAYIIRPTNDGGYIAVGWTEPTGGDKDIYLIKLDEAGNIEWQRYLGGKKDDKGHDVCQTSDGGYLVVGWTKSWGAGSGDLYIIKTDEMGKELWHKAFGGKKNDGPADFGVIQKTPNGGYLLAGWTWSYGKALDMWLVRLNRFGNLMRSKTIGGEGTDWARSITACSDGNFIIVGKTTSFGAGKGDIYVVKVDVDGNVIWERNFGGTGMDWANYVLEVPGGGFLVVGGTRSYGNGEDDTYVIRLDEQGNKLWERVFPESEGKDWGLTCRLVPEKGFLLTSAVWRCCTGWDAEVLYIDFEGNLLGKIVFGGHGEDTIYLLQPTQDGGYIGVGETNSYGAGDNDVYFVKIKLEL